MNVRADLERLMRQTLADRRNWTYRAVRPLPVPPSWKPGQHVVADCSWACRLLATWAHAPDPMGDTPIGYGNSTTIAAHLEHLLAPLAMRPGDIVTFGVNGSEHAAMVLEPGIDPVLWSFGHQGAPNLYRLSEDHRPHQLLRLPTSEKEPPTPAELRKKVGYWSWLKWTLGEGEWSAYEPFDKRVRPDVPRLIPPRWWAARIRFLAARTKPNPPKGPA